MASRRTNLNGIQEKGRDTRYRHPCPLLFVEGFERNDYQRLPAPRSAPPPPPPPGRFSWGLASFTVIVRPFN